MSEKEAGRPATNDPEDIETVQSKIDGYFKTIDEDNPPTFNGLARALGYKSRTSLWEASKKDIPISEPIKVAMMRVEEAYEKRLFSASPTGAIFALKNRGWSDKSEVEVSGKDGSPMEFRFVEPNASPKDI